MNGTLMKRLLVVSCLLLSASIIAHDLKKDLPMQPTILITGGAGYIGSHTAFLMAQKGYKVIILDTLNHGQSFDHAWATLIQKDCADEQTLEEIFTKYDVQAVMHFAAFMEVGLSVKDPMRFYENNVVKTIRLLNTMLAHNVKTFIFSSSAATYGTPQMVPIPETHPLVPINPYGNNKLIVEKVLHDYHHAYGLNYVALRYFNAAGALPEHGLGEVHSPESHVIPLILRAARDGRPFNIFGSDYPTPDGTCIRDYLHVLDIAQAHVQALEHLEAGNPSDCFNLGTGKGTSVKEMIDAVERITHTQVKKVFAPRREGDPAVLVADPSKAMNILHWKPQFSDIDYIVKSAFVFEQNLSVVDSREVGKRKNP